MTNNKKFLIIQSALCILTAVLFSAAAIRIFLTGSAYQAAGHPAEWIYTREKVGAALLPILPVLLISVAMTIYGLVKGIEDEEKDKPVKDVEITRDLTCARITAPSEEMTKERELQKKLKIGGWVGFGICMVPIFLYITNGNHFAEPDVAGVEKSILSLAANVIPWTVLGLACLIVATILMEKSMQRETDAATARSKEGAGAPPPKQSAEKSSAPSPEQNAGQSSAPSAKQNAEQSSAPSPGQNSGQAEGVKKPARTARPDFNIVGPERAKRRVLIRRILLAAAVCFVIMGIFNGSMKDVLIKAIKICTECVGLG